MSNIYGRQVVEALVNKSGGGVIAGDVVIIDTSNNGAFTTSTAGAFTGLSGIAQETIASNATGRVLTAGYAALVNVNASVTRGNFGKTYTVAKQATDAGASRVAGAFCQFLTGGTTPTAHVFGIADNTSGAGTGTLTTVEEADGSPTDSAVTKIVFPNGTLGIASHVATYTPAVVTPTALTTAGPTNVGANVSIGNGSYADIVSQAVTAGTWLVLWNAQIQCTAGRVIQVDIANDAGTELQVYDQVMGSTVGEMNGFAVIVAAGADHAKLRMASNGAGDVARGTTAWTNPATSIMAIRIA